MKMNMKHEATKYYLFAHSYLCDEIRNRLRRKYKLKIFSNSREYFKYLFEEHEDDIDSFFSSDENPSIKEVNNNPGLMWAYQYEITDYIFKEIPILCRNLDINKILFYDLLLFENIPHKKSGPKRLYVNKDEITHSSGRVFLSVDDLTTNADILELKRRAKNILKLKNKLGGKKNKKKRKETDSLDDISLKFYINVEKELIKLSESNIEDDYGKTREFTGLAFERAAGYYINFMEENSQNMNNVDEKKLKNLIRNHYYEVKRRYELPTEQDYKEILELINL